MALTAETRLAALSHRLESMARPDHIVHLEGEIAAIRKENEALLAQTSGGARGGAKILPAPPTAATRSLLQKASNDWSIENSFRLCDDGQIGPFKDKAHFMDKSSIWSLRSAVEQLNGGALHSTESWIAVFSERCQEWYVLFKPGLKEVALRHFGVCDDSAHRVGQGSPASPARQARQAAFALPSDSLAPRPTLRQWEYGAQEVSVPGVPAPGSLPPPPPFYGAAPAAQAAEGSSLPLSGGQALLRGSPVGSLGWRARGAAPVGAQSRPMELEVNQLEAMAKQLESAFNPRSHAAESIAQSGVWLQSPPSAAFHPGSHAPHAGRHPSADVGS